jgi:hypothetical protein
MEFVVNSDLPSGDPCLNVIVFVKVGAPKTFCLKVLNNQGTETDREVSSSKSNINFTQGCQPGFFIR